MINKSVRVGGMRYIDEYINKLIMDLDHMKKFSNSNNIEKIADLILVTKQNNGDVYIIGNGGSSSTAQHFAQGLCDAGIIAWCLSDNMSLSTALANDIGYDNIYIRQLENIIRRNDLIIGISGSGNSPNIVKAIEYAQRYAKTACFLGFTGGKLKEICENYIWVEDDNYGRVEDVHLSLAHIISHLVRRKIKGV